MGRTKISWCHFTQNFWVGCSKLSPACANCYAEGWANRDSEEKIASETLRIRRVKESLSRPRRERILSGFPCPKCEDSMAVVDSRTVEGNQGNIQIRRRRCCRGCDYRLTTYEQIAEEVGKGVDAEVLDNIKELAKILAEKLHDLAESKGARPQDTTVNFRPLPPSLIPHETYYGDLE